MSKLSKIRFSEGFIYRGYTFGWKNKVLYRLPLTTEDGREYPLRLVPKITIYNSKKGDVQGFRVLRDKKTIQQLRRMTVAINVEVEQNNCRECA